MLPVKGGTWGLVRILADKRTTSVSPSVVWYWLRWNSGPTTCCVRACVCGGGCTYGCFSFRARQMSTVPYILTSGEVVLTTYMVLVLILERPALLSAPRPQTSPSSCTVLQLRKGNLYSGEQAVSTLPRTGCRIRVFYNIHWLTNSPNHNCSSGRIARASTSMLLYSTSVSCDVLRILLRLQKLFIRSSDWRRADQEARALYQN